MRMFSMHTFDHDRAARARCTDALIGLLARGAIRPAIHDRIPLAQVAHGWVFGNAIAVFGVINIIYAAYVALAQRDIRHVLHRLHLD